MAEEDIFRGCSKNLPQSVWGDIFASLSQQDYSELESLAKEVEEYKQKVKNMLVDSARDLADNVQIINLLCRLGLSYHFEDEIDEQLGHIFPMLPKHLGEKDYDLCTLANLFRVLRQYGYNITCDIFKKFKDEDGQFKKDIANDVKGILSLYEACFLASDDDHILDEALVFTRKHLEILAENSNPRFQKYIRNVLMCPSHRTMERLDALHYITFYNEDESAKKTLLDFAKLDYNRVQLIYRKELAILSKWWKNGKAMENLPFLRDRLMEAYVWGLGIVFEPQYSSARMLICKYIAVLTLMDDTYDSYGTIDELRLFTDALERFNLDAVDELPEYMKFLYKLILELAVNDGTEGCYSKTSFAKEVIKELGISFNLEAIWQAEGKVPSFDEYMRNGNVSSTYNCIAAAFILGMENLGMKEISWVQNDPQIVVGSKFHPRFLNDINGALTDETDRGDCPKAVDCYMKEYGVSQDEAIAAITKFLEDKWKGMNEDVIKYRNSMPMILLKCTLNFARTGIFYYERSDLYTYESKLKLQVIKSLLVTPLSM